MNSRYLIVVSAAAGVLAASGLARGQCATQRLSASDRATGDEFATALGGHLDTASNPRVLVGSPKDNTAGGTDAGSAYFFTRSGGTWAQGAHLFADDAEPSAFFGAAVDCVDPFAAVGAPGDGVGGAVYFFQRSGNSWVQEYKLPVAFDGSDAGRAVAVTTDAAGNTWALIGAPLADGEYAVNPGQTEVDSGAALFARRQSGTWTNTQTFGPYTETHTDVTGAQFGASVALRFSIGVVGSPYEEDQGMPVNSGGARIYRRSGTTWVLDAHLKPSPALGGDYFGKSVATDAIIVAVGAPGDDATAAELPELGAKNDSGCVYLYRYSGGAWVPDGRVFAPDASDGAQFGSSVAVRGSSLMVSAPGANKAYLFRRTGDGAWAAIAAYRDPDSAGVGAFGTPVTIAGDQVVIGDRLDDLSPATDQGAAHTFTMPGVVYGADRCEEAVSISGMGQYTGCTGVATGSGSAQCMNVTGPDVWYEWVPSCSMPVTVDTFGSLYDTVLEISTGCPGEPGRTVVACNDDVGQLNLVSSVAFTTQAGTRYLIRVSGYGAEEAGAFTLNVGYGNVPANNECTGATVIGTGTTTFANCRATTGGTQVAGCDGQTLTLQNDLWFKFISPCPGAVTVSTLGSTFDTVLSVHGAPICPISSTAMACDDDSVGTAARVTFNAVQGQDYYLRVGSRFAGQYGDGVLTVSCGSPCPCDWNGVNGLTTQDIYDFLTSWSGGSGDFNQMGGTTVQDIYDFLTCWSAGCN